MWNRLNTSLMFCQSMYGLSFYGVMVVLTRFFLEELNYSEADTMMVVGAFSAIGPLFAIAGGFIADKFLGAYRSLTISYVGFTLGYILLVFGSSVLNVPLSLSGIALASYSAGLMAPSFPSLYRNTFASQADFENGFPVNYSIKNLGAVIGQYTYPMFIFVLGYKGSFMMSAVMASLGLLILVVFRGSLVKVSGDKDQSPVGVKNWVLFLLTSTAMIALVFFMFSNMDIGKNIVYAISLTAILYFVSLIFKASKAEKIKLGTILIMIALTTVFLVYYGQIMTSMNMVTMNTMRGDLFGFIPIAPEAAMAMNPLWCMVAGPVIAYVFSSLEKRGVNFTTATKVAMAFVLTAIAFGVLTASVLTIGEDVVLQPEVFLAVHFFQSFAEVIVGTMVVAFILSVAPKRIESFSVSLYSVAIALSGIIGAVFSTSIAMDEEQVVTQRFVQEVYGGYFSKLTLAALVMVVVALVCSAIIRRLLNKANLEEHELETSEA
ncbi:oligopeptide:H+ symporter [Vibrio hannami]|uniref:oligopeptide:H+ symporter n=1 Tax=Vibrio hannami TaxID=2717094 RepID=UPI00240F3C45|nr:oligopeptide:H+ symporter [Vibrio hannami]MDG3088588.1 oligopeptide:H+ symporter [Vibrio hannami]